MKYKYHFHEWNWFGQKVVNTKGTKEWACSNVNFSKGCSNGCRYCYARRMANRFGWKKYDDWPNMENKNEMARKGFKKRQGWIMSPSSHDITRSNINLALKIFSNILQSGNNLLIVSKPRLKLVKQLCEELLPWKKQILFRFTIGTLNDKIRRYWEPFAPSVRQRLKTLEYTYNEDWSNSVSVEPFLDGNLLELIDTINPFVNQTIWIGPMNKIHVPKELWTDELTQLYSPLSLSKFKTKIDALNNSKIRYKDHFLTILKRSERQKVEKSSQYQTIMSVTAP